MLARVVYLDLGLLLDPVPLQAPLGAAFIGGRHRPDAAADHASQREDEPPEVPCELQQRLHKSQNAIPCAGPADVL